MNAAEIEAERLSAVKAKKAIFENAFKKTFEPKRVHKVGHLDDNLTDVSKYMSTVKVKQSTVPADWVNPLDTALINVSNYKSAVTVKQSTVSADMVNPLHMSFADLSHSSEPQVRSTVAADMVKKLDASVYWEFEPSERDHSESLSASNRCVNNMRPGSRADFDFDRKEQEQLALDELTEFLDKMVGLSSTKARTMSFQELRIRYMKAISTLTPELFEPKKGVEDKANPEFVKQRLAHFKQQAAKKETFSKMQGLWKKFEAQAQDRPLEPTQEDDQISEQIQNAANQVIMGWGNYAQQVAEDLEDDDFEDPELLRHLEDARRIEETQLDDKLEVPEVEEEKMIERGEEEQEAMDNLNDFLKVNQESSSSLPSWNSSFHGLRCRYLEAVTRLKPKLVVPRNAQEAATPEFKQHRKAHFKQEAEKNQTFTKMRELWDTFEDRAQDRPHELSPEDRKIEEEIEQAEDAVVTEWSNYAEQVVDDLDEDDCDDEDLLRFIEEARVMREKAEKREKKKEKAARRRKARLEEERLMKEDKELLEEAKKLREASKMGKKKY